MCWQKLGEIGSNSVYGSQPRLEKDIFIVFRNKKNFRNKLIFLLIYSIFFLVICFIWSLIFSNLFGAPFIPTSKEKVDQILREANLKKGQVFVDLGSGDGSLLKKAVRQYQTKGIGFEINPFLVIYSRFKSRLEKIKNISFERKNVFSADLNKANVIFLYLMPDIIDKLRVKLEKQTRKGTLIISHRFEIYGWENKLIKKLDDSHPFTFFYKNL